jgi:hypothetical protein
MAVTDGTACAAVPLQPLPGGPTVRSRRLFLAPLALGVALLLTACNGLVGQHAVYTRQSTQTITGTAPARSNDPLVGVTVNGTPAVLGKSHDYSLTIPLDGAAVFNQVLVVATYQSGHTETDRATIAYGDGTHATIVDRGAAVASGVALRMNQQAFAKLGPVVKSLTTIDTASITPPGTVVLDQCVVKLIFCQTQAKATIAAAPTLSGFDVALTSHAGSTEANVTLHSLKILTQVNTTTLGIISIPCQLEITAATVGADGNYVLEPNPANPSQLRVDLQGATNVTLSGVAHQWTGGVCSLPGVSTIVDLLLPNVQTLLQTNLTQALADPDGSGPAQAPIAVAIQQSLAKVNIAGPIGDSLGVALTAPIHGVVQDANGVGLTADATFAASAVAAGAPQQNGSLGFGNPVVADPGATTPGGQAYDVAVGASITSFDQLLAGETERGLLNLNIDTLNGQPLTYKGLLDLIGLGSIVTTDRPVKIVLTPELAPAITGAAAPAGSLGLMHIGGYRSDVVFADTGEKLLSLVLDFDAPVNLSIGGGQLGFALTAPPADQVHLDVVTNPLGLPTALVSQVFAALEPGLFDQLGSLLPAFPLPQLVGLSLSPVTTARVGDSLFLYANLT